jgi:hypothetical protein
VGLRNNEEIIVSHLMFVDDTLIFCEANCKQLCHEIRVSSCSGFGSYSWVSSVIFVDEVVESSFGSFLQGYCYLE